jgi:hypothetical protein
LTFVELTRIRNRPRVSLRGRVVVREGRVGSEHISDWNDQVRQLADSLSDSAETKFGFSCQCGCGTVVALTSRNFDAEGAWADGHKPDTTSDWKLPGPYSAADVRRG